jgi:spore coat protein U-like protein
MRRISKQLAFAFALALGAALPASAAFTCSGSNVSMSLGAYNGFQATDLDSSGVLVVTCRRNGGGSTTTITVGIGPSAVSGSIATRRLRLAAGTDVLGYNLFRDAGRSLVWGQTVGVNTVSQNISLSNNASGTLSFTLFGRITALQDVRAGTYNDTLTMTVTF